MIHIRETVTVSNGTDTAPSIRELPKSTEDKPMVSVRFYKFQGSKDQDIPAIQLNAVFFGENARQALAYLSPGKVVEVQGYLLQTTREYNGKTYVNNDLRNASWRRIYGDTDVPSENTQAAPQAAAPQQYQPAPQAAAAPQQYQPAPQATVPQAPQAPQATVPQAPQAPQVATAPQIPQAPQPSGVPRGPVRAPSVQVQPSGIPG